MTVSEDSDAAVAAFIQGALASCVMRSDFPVYIEELDNPSFKVAPNTMGGITVAVERDENGDYQHWFTITTRSGAKVRVTVEPELDQEESTT